MLKVRVIAWLTAENAPIASSDTSVYCQARKRLPEKLLQKLFGTVAHNLEQKVTSQHLWCGRHVKVIDGTTVSIPDTSCNSLSFPSVYKSVPSCGFPIAEIGAIFSIATGAAVAVVIDVFSTHDVKLARLLYQFLNPGDILLGSTAFCSYTDISFIQNHNCDAVLRLSQARKNQIERGRRKPISSFESIEVWHKPSTRPKGWSQDKFTSIPKTLTVRVIKYYIPSPGYRPKYVTLVTTLLDPKVYPTTEIMRLYGQRC